MKRKHNWAELQKEYDSGCSGHDLIRKYKLNWSTIMKAVRRNEFKLRNKADALNVRIKQYGPTVKAHSEKTKELISKRRRTFLEENPDKVPYLINHSSKESYPEKIFRNALESSGITGWVQSYQNGIYEYDFAFPSIKLDIEIDGGTHNLDKVKKIDTRRDEWTTSNGWTVYRFTAKEVKLDVVKCINKIQEFVNSVTQGA